VDNFVKSGGWIIGDLDLSHKVMPQTTMVKTRTKKNKGGKRDYSSMFCLHCGTQKKEKPLLNPEDDECRMDLANYVVNRKSAGLRGGGEGPALQEPIYTGVSP